MTESEPAETAKRPRRWWPIVAAIAGVIGVFAMVAAVIGAWGLRVATDSDRFESKMQSLLEREDVSEALADRVVTSLATQLDLRAEVDAVLPPRLAAAAGQFLDAIVIWAEDTLAGWIRESSDVVASIAGAAHAELVDVLTDDGLTEGLSVEGGDVRINLLPLVSRALLALQDIGLLSNVDVPVFDRMGDPDEQRAEFSAALGRDLDPEFGTPVVYSSDSLEGNVERAQHVLTLAIRLLWVLLIGGLALAIVSFWLSRRRFRAGCFIVGGAFALFLVVHFVVDRVRRQAAGLVDGEGAKVALSETLRSLERSLTWAMLLFVLVLAIVVGLAVWVTHPRRRGAAAG